MPTFMSLRRLGLDLEELCELHRLHPKDPGSFLKAGAAQTSLKRFMSCQSQCLPPGHLTCSCFKARVNLWLLSCHVAPPGGRNLARACTPPLARKKDIKGDL